MVLGKRVRFPMCQLQLTTFEFCAVVDIILDICTCTYILLYWCLLTFDYQLVGRTDTKASIYTHYTDITQLFVYIRKVNRYLLFALEQCRWNFIIRR